MAIFPLAPDQTIAQMWSNGARGGPRTVINQVKTTSSGATAVQNSTTILMYATAAPEYPQSKLLDNSNVCSVAYRH